MTKAKSSVFTDFVAPIGVLFLICVVMTFLLALTNGATAPIIEQAELEAAQAARKQVMPDADDFELLPDEKQENEDKSITVTEVYKASNGAGYVFMITAKGYGGKNTLKMVVGIDMDGKLTGTNILSHAETVGLGAKIAGDDFQSQFPGQDRAFLEKSKEEGGMIPISGATFSSNYFRAALEHAFEVYDTVKGAA